MKTNVDGLAQAIQKTLAEYEGVTIESMKAAVDKASNEAVRELKSSSPKRNGAYARSWTSKKKKLASKYAYEPSTSIFVMLAPTAIPFNKSTAEIITPFNPYNSSKEDNAGRVPAPQNHKEFAGFKPCFFLSMLIG